MRRPGRAGGAEAFAEPQDLCCGMQKMRWQGPHQEAELSMVESNIAPPTCLACHCERKFVSVERVKRGHEIRDFECPKCGSVLRLAQKIRGARSKPVQPAWTPRPKQ
jgi:predicted SprT family Zn-dependent metalloprotease